MSLTVVFTKGLTGKDSLKVEYCQHSHDPTSSSDVSCKSPQHRWYRRFPCIPEISDLTMSRPAAHGPHAAFTWPQLRDPLPILVQLGLSPGMEDPGLFPWTSQLYWTFW